MLTLLSLLSPALASEWFLETGARPDRAEVAAWEQKEVEAGMDAHLVRRFVDGQGWRFVLRADGLADEDAAMEAARGMADRIGVAVTVIELDAGKSTRRGDVTPSGKRTVAAAPATEVDADAGEALARAVAAMGDTEPLLTAIRDGKVLFGYRRTMADGRVVDHTWAAADAGLYLETDPVEGAVVASKLKVLDDQAWLSVDGGAWTAQNAEKARTTIESTGPSEVVPLVWQLSRAVETRREFERMRVAAPGTFDGKPTTVLEFGGDAVTGALVLELTADGLPCRVRFGGEAEVHEYRDWSRTKGVAIPGEVRTWRGGKLSDTVAVDAVDAAPNLPVDWFRPPSRTAQ